jgi:hypothetical protein
MWWSPTSGCPGDGITATAALLARRPGTLVTVHGDPVPTGGDLVWAIKALIKALMKS